MRQQTHTAQEQKQQHLDTFSYKFFRAEDHHGVITHSRETLARLISVDNEKVRKVAVLGYD